MHTHFSSFTPEAMRALGQEFLAGFQSRRDFIEKTRKYIWSMLSDFRQVLRGAEDQRRQRAAQEADGRRLFVSELRSGVHALKTRFELARRDAAADLRQMAGELHAARDALRKHPAQPEKEAKGRQSAEAPRETSSRPAQRKKPAKKR